MMGDVCVAVQSTCHGLTSGHQSVWHTTPTISLVPSCDLKCAQSVLHMLGPFQFNLHIWVMQVVLSHISVGATPHTCNLHGVSVAGGAWFTVQARILDAIAIYYGGCISGGLWRG